MQEHEGEPLILRHRELGPQGELIHGSIGVSITDGAKIPYNHYEISLIEILKRYFEKNYSKLTWIVETVCEGITSEAWFATANRTMVYDSASALLTTRIRTWVNTFVILTSQIQRAIRTNCTLWFTIRRYTYIS